MRRSLCLLATVAIAFFTANPATASIVYSSATFTNFTVLTNNATQFSASGDILQGGVVAGTITGTMVYGGGTNPFNSGSLWGTGAEFRIGGSSTATAEANETADGFWSFTITPNANWSVDGVSLLSNGTVLGNPTFANLTSNGAATVHDDNQGAADELLGNYDDGDLFVNGTDLVFNDGTLSTGITGAAHARLWSYDSVGATNLSFTYESGPVSNISNEGLALDVQLSFAIPEPSSIALMFAAGMGLLARRRR